MVVKNYKIISASEKEEELEERLNLFFKEEGEGDTLHTFLFNKDVSWMKPYFALPSNSNLKEIINTVLSEEEVDLSLLEKVEYAYFINTKYLRTHIDSIMSDICSTFNLREETGEFDSHQIVFLENSSSLFSFYLNNREMNGELNSFYANISSVEDLSYSGDDINFSLNELYKHLLKSSDKYWHLILQNNVTIQNFNQDTIQEIIRQASTLGTHYINLITSKEEQIPSNIKNIYHTNFNDSEVYAQLISTEGLKILENTKVENPDKLLNPVVWKNDIFQYKVSEINNNIGYPLLKPDVPKMEHTWFCQKIAPYISKLVERYNLKVGVELGSWYGTGSLGLLKNCNLEKLYCVDRWDADFIKENPNIYFNNYKMLETYPLYETFLSNTWEERKNIIPLKCDTVESIEMIKYLPYQPDIFFIDGEHSFRAVTAELEAIFKHFPNKIVFGTNYEFGFFDAIPKAVRDFREKHSDVLLTVRNNHFFLIPESFIQIE